jgi:hypothetical protein
MPATMGVGMLSRGIRTAAATNRIATARATAAGADDVVYVIGRSFDTAVARDWPGHKILDIPDWTPGKNRAWIQSIIDARAKVYIGSPQTPGNLLNPVTGRARPFAEELKQLMDAGYRQVGDYLLPPGS